MLTSDNEKELDAKVYRSLMCANRNEAPWKLASASKRAPLHLPLYLLIIELDSGYSSMAAIAVVVSVEQRYRC
jgi:hypothetical protein